MDLRQYGERVAIGALRSTVELAWFGLRTGQAVGSLAVRPMLAGARYVAGFATHEPHFSERLACEVLVNQA